MTEGEVRALFAPFAEVDVRRMFGGTGVYAEGLCFALAMGGEVFLKVDGATREAFERAGSTPFVHHARGKPTATSFWRLPDGTARDPETLRRWALLGLEAARRKATAGKARRKP